MKKLINFLAAVLLTASVFAQSSQKMSYQAVIPDGSNNLDTSHAVGMRVSISQGTMPMYAETQTPIINANGLVTIEIGTGITTDDFATIDWSAGAYSIKTETDPTGGTNYKHYVGELYGGGVVFYVDNTGNHGLICSMIDNSTSQAWSDVTATTSAADLCDVYINVDYGTGVYSDWYLPTIDQLNKLYYSVDEVNKALDNDGNAATTAITKNYYWSSSWYSDYAWYLPFYAGGANGASKGSTYYVRAIRAF